MRSPLLRILAAAGVMAAGGLLWIGASGGSAKAGPAPQGRATTRPASRPATQPAEAIHFTRSGGFAGDRVELTIEPDGRYVVMHRRLPPPPGKPMSGRLDARRVAAAFEGWADVNADYPTPAGAADLYGYEIRYASRTVNASGGADLPPTLLRVIDLFEATARGEPPFPLAGPTTAPRQ